MKVKIKRFDSSLPIPAYQTNGAAGFDCYARETIVIPTHTIAYIPLNIGLEIPEDCWVLVAARGSTHKMGIMPINGIGVGDWDFCGDNDEYKFAVYNFTDNEVTIEKGTRVAQMIIMKYEQVELTEVDHFEHKDRGAFGSTGKK